MLLFFLSSGLFLGWSLGANDASNVFGTAVATRMVKFKTAAYVCSIFIVLGAVISGAGASHTLGKLGAVNAIAGSFMVALAAAFTVYWMTRAGLPVSTSQAIVGAIIGWNFFSGTLTDYNSLTKIVTTWVICPFLAAAISIVLYKIAKLFLSTAKIHLLRMDSYTRISLIFVGAFGSYSLGANNIANVMGVFVPVAPFKSLNFFGIFHFSSAQQLFFLGAVAISVGVFTYSYRVMTTVGNELVKLTPIAALIVVLSESIVLFLFASESLSNWLISHGLPSIPLVPVSSSQAVVGAVLGIGIARGGKGIKFKTLGNIAVGWIATPVAAALISFFALFFLQNVFNQEVYRPVQYEITQETIAKLNEKHDDITSIQDLKNIRFADAVAFKKAIRQKINDRKLEKDLFIFAEIDSFHIDKIKFKILDQKMFTQEQLRAVRQLIGKEFSHKWQFYDQLLQYSDDWKKLPNEDKNKKYNKEIEEKLNYLFDTFRVQH
ncbi:inorganic phosphate transporter [candidate division KSB1 bacterium 4484_87]|nr:MAG: inorganic phosphate transporter [candidate division KSB1 bacterium 4484_87]